MNGVLDSFLPPVREWFTRTYGTPTPPQDGGWPAIQRGEHTLILAPTGSGKTLAAFLWALDRLFRRGISGPPSEAAGPDQQGAEPGVRLVYISPLKALNNDIHRNLRVPLAGIRRTAETLGLELPEITVAVRSGDTPPRERRAVARKPPDILITTPESIYILLTGAQGRAMFRTVKTVIVDEVHALAGSKRGVHLAVSLERLEEAADEPVQRIGLSATIRPLEEVAGFLGGAAWTPAGQLEPRPVTIVDAGYRKPLDLRLETVVEDFRELPGGSVWPAIIPRVSTLIDEHTTTLIFANNRRLAERTADRLNAYRNVREESEEGSALMEDGVATGQGIFALGRGLGEGAIKAHHGSMSREARLKMERELKEGAPPALVGTASLELGIDIGAVDLVVQLQSPKAVAQGLQRVGRSGHLVGQTSKGRIFSTHREDLVEAAAVVRGMLAGDVEATTTPRNPLDVLAQQIVAMVAAREWQVDELLAVVRRAYPYRDLTPRAYQAVLEMVSGRFSSEVHRTLRPRIHWDRVNGRLLALPGSRLQALLDGGTIPDTGSFGAYLPDGKTRIGELDEEFVFETRPGDTFALGSQVWRVLDIDQDRVVVVEAPGAVPRMPFWHGDFPWRPFELGQRVGALRRELVEQLQALRAATGTATFREALNRSDHPAVARAVAGLRDSCALDVNSAAVLLDYVAGQLDGAGAISTDRTVLVEVFDDALGDPRLVVHSPFGGRVNGPWGLALAGALRERTGVQVEVQTNDDGILLRFPEADADFPLDIVGGLGPAEARERVLRELPDSAVFGARFRQNAGRALLLPGRKGGKRTPFWLQRLRARDLLQAVRGFEDFPIVAETYRDCLEDVMDLPHLEQVLGGIERGEIEVVAVESAVPSPVAHSLLRDFINIYMYEWDVPKAERQLQSLSVNRELLQDLLRDVAFDELLRPEALDDLRAHLQHIAATARARTPDELVLALEDLGDLTLEEVEERTTRCASAWLAALESEGRVARVAVRMAGGVEQRWAAAEYAAEYRDAFTGDRGACSRILERYLRVAGPVTVDAIRARYAFPRPWLQAELERLVDERRLAHGSFTPGTSRAVPPAERTDASGGGSGEGTKAAEYVEVTALEQLHRRTLGILRREVQAVPYTVYADLLARWQHVTPAERLSGLEGLRSVLEQLRAAPIAAQVWERDVLPARLRRYDPADLDALVQGGELVWVFGGGADPRRARVRFLFRGEGRVFLDVPPADLDELAPVTRSVHAFLREQGAVFFADLRDGLGVEAPAIEAALMELALAGLATNDGVGYLRRLVHQGSPRQAALARERFRSSLEDQLRERRGSRPRRPAAGPSGHPAYPYHHGPGVRPGRAAFRAAEERVRRRLGGEGAGDEVFGRWSLVHRVGVLGPELSADELASRRARQLLLRWGLVTRAHLRREEGPWEWAELYRQLQRMEMRGEVRRGYFVRGLPGAQFALPEVVEQLRSLAGAPSRGEEAPLLVLNACDPANLCAGRLGGSEPDDQTVTSEASGLTVPRVPSTWIVQQRGLPVLAAEGWGRRLVPGPGVDGEIVSAAREMVRDALQHIPHR